MENKIQGKLLECISSGLFNENADKDKHHFKLNFKAELENGDQVLCSFSIFYNKTKALEYCSSIIHALQPDASQGDFESLFLADNDINIKKYFKALPIDCNISIKEHIDKAGETRTYYNLSGLRYEAPKAQSIKEIPVKFNFKTGKMEPCNTGDSEVPF